MPISLNCKLPPVVLFDQFTIPVVQFAVMVKVPGKQIILGLGTETVGIDGFALICKPDTVTLASLSHPFKIHFAEIL